MPRENSKCRQWQKQRRDRLKEAFDDLAKVLPNFEPSINICQIDILRQAATAIQELQEEVKKVTTIPSDGEKCPKDDIIRKLHERVRRLLCRNEQLAKLLQDAGIKIPKYVGAVGILKNLTRSYRWKNKITPEKAKLLSKAEMEKENITGLQNSAKTRKPKKSISRQLNKSNRPTTKKRNVKKLAGPSCLYVLPQPVTVRTNVRPSCYLLSNTVPGSISKLPSNKSGITHLKPVISSTFNPAISQLGPGTIIFKNTGAVIPIISQPQVILPTPPSILSNTLPTLPVPLINPLTSKESVDVKQKIVSLRTSKLPILRPLCSTTQINKVPIPALTSRYGSNQLLLGNKVESDSKNMDVSKPQKRKVNTKDKFKAKKANIETSGDTSNTSISQNHPPLNKDVVPTSTDTEKALEPSTIDQHKGMSETDKVVTSTSYSANEDAVPPSNCCSKNEETSSGDLAPKSSNVHPEAVVSNKIIEHTISTQSSTPTSSDNKQLPISSDEVKKIDLNIPHADLSHDIFASLHDSTCHNPEATSPTAAFLLSFPLVSSIKANEAMDDDNSRSQQGTPNLLQIGNIDSMKPSQMEGGLVNLDNFSLFSKEEQYFSTYGNLENNTPSTTNNLGVKSEMLYLGSIQKPEFAILETKKEKRSIENKVANDTLSTKNYTYDAPTEKESINSKQNQDIIVHQDVTLNKNGDLLSTVHNTEKIIREGACEPIQASAEDVANHKKSNDNKTDIESDLVAAFVGNEIESQFENKVCTKAENKVLAVLSDNPVQKEAVGLNQQSVVSMNQNKSYSLIQMANTDSSNTSQINRNNNNNSSEQKSGGIIQNSSKSSSEQNVKAISRDKCTKDIENIHGEARNTSEYKINNAEKTMDTIVQDNQTISENAVLGVHCGTKVRDMEPRIFHSNKQKLNHCSIDENINSQCTTMMPNSIINSYKDMQPAHKTSSDNKSINFENLSNNKDIKIQNIVNHNHFTNSNANIQPIHMTRNDNESINFENMISKKDIKTQNMSTNPNHLINSNKNIQPAHMTKSGDKIIANDSSNKDKNIQNTNNQPHHIVDSNTNIQPVHISNNDNMGFENVMINKDVKIHNTTTITKHLTNSNNIQPSHVTNTNNNKSIIYENVSMNNDKNTNRSHCINAESNVQPVQMNKSDKSMIFENMSTNKDMKIENITNSNHHINSNTNTQISHMSKNDAKGINFENVNTNIFNSTMIKDHTQVLVYENLNIENTKNRLDMLNPGLAYGNVNAHFYGLNGKNDSGMNSGRTMKNDYYCNNYCSTNVSNNSYSDNGKSMQPDDHKNENSNKQIYRNSASTTSIKRSGDETGSTENRNQYMTNVSNLHQRIQNDNEYFNNNTFNNRNEDTKMTSKVNLESSMNTSTTSSKNNTILSNNTSNNKMNITNYGENTVAKTIVNENTLKFTVENAIISNLTSNVISENKNIHFRKSDNVFSTSSTVTHDTDQFNFFQHDSMNLYKPMLDNKDFKPFNANLGKPNEQSSKLQTMPTTNHPNIKAMPYISYPNMAPDKQEKPCKHSTNIPVSHYNPYDTTATANIYHNSSKISSTPNMNYMYHNQSAVSNIDHTFSNTANPPYNKMASVNNKHQGQNKFSEQVQFPNLGLQQQTLPKPFENIQYGLYNENPSKISQNLNKLTMDVASNKDQNFQYNAMYQEKNKNNANFGNICTNIGSNNYNIFNNNGSMTYSNDNHKPSTANQSAKKPEDVQNSYILKSQNEAASTFLFPEKPTNDTKNVKDTKISSNNHSQYHNFYDKNNLGKDVPDKTGNISKHMSFDYQDKTKDNNNLVNNTKISNDKQTDQYHKESEQRSQCYFAAPYTNTVTNFTYTNEPPKIITTCTYMNLNKNYANPIYSNTSNYNYDFHTDPTFNQNYYKPPTSKSDGKSQYPFNYENYHNTNMYEKDKKNDKTKAPPQNKPVNWMTTPENKPQTSECLMPRFPTQSYSFASAEPDAIIPADPKKITDVPMIPDDKQFSWSPTKLPNFLEPTNNIVTPTLPTLVGDLALGNPLPFTDQKFIKEAKRKGSADNQPNFFSVSQLVDGKAEAVPGRVSSRRSSGNRSKTSTHTKNKRTCKNEASNNDKNNQNKPTGDYNIENNAGEMFYDNKPLRSSNKNTSNYSAEALIGNPSSDIGMRKPSFPSTKPTGSSSFLTENIITYFPTVDDNYMTQSHNFQPSTFPHNSLQNNVFSTNSFIYSTPTITSTYLPNTFETTTHDYMPDNFNPMLNANVKDTKGTISKNFKQTSKDDKSNNFTKKTKKKQVSESNSGVTNFDFSFLTMPGSTNSPILPEDFHSHTTFLPPTAPYPCKNNPYQKQSNEFSTNTLLPMPPLPRNNIQHPEVSPSMNSGGTSLTNFNLSAIFPEINKATATNLYPDNRNKDTNSTSLQVPFNIEQKYNFSS